MRFKAGLTETPQEITVVDETGTVRRGINWLLTEEEMGQVREGYRCLNCMQRFQEAFPEKCLVCGFHVRDQQSFELQRQHQGDLDVGPSPAMRELQEQRERETWKPSGTSQIWLPGRPLA